MNTPFGPIWFWIAFWVAVFGGVYIYGYLEKRAQLKRRHRRDARFAALRTHMSTINEIRQQDSQK